MTIHRGAVWRSMLAAAALGGAALLGGHQGTPRKFRARHPGRGAPAPLLSLVLSDVVRIQEQERHRIARDLHDQLGQRVTALRLKVESLDRRRPGNGGAPVEDLLGLIDLIDQELDLLAWQLRPPALDAVGLAAALASYLREWSRNYGIAAEFAARGVDGRFASDVETCVYRIAQEALHNVVKHAPAGGRRIGLVGMRERAALVGGSVDIEAAPFRGTAVFARVPLVPPAAGLSVSG
jgi:two-component system, chemotaxis family, sensor kinase Cph1